MKTLKLVVSLCSLAFLSLFENNAYSSDSDITSIVNTNHLLAAQASLLNLGYYQAGISADNPGLLGHQSCTVSYGKSCQIYALPGTQVTFWASCVHGSDKTHYCTGTTPMEYVGNGENFEEISIDTNGYMAGTCFNVSFNGIERYLENYSCNF